MSEKPCRPGRSALPPNTWKRKNIFTKVSGQDGVTGIAPVERRTS
jgi:hypothetical protein